MPDRLNDAKEFYWLLEQAERKMGGRRQLGSLTGRLSMPQRGVYFFFEPHETRTSTGTGGRVVRVGTHALTANSRSTLGGRLKQHRGLAIHDDDGHPVHIVANPQLAPKDGNRYSRPDDPISDTFATFRDLLQAYNDQPGINPWNLLRAGELYDVPVYTELRRRIAPSKLFILSAGWGLIRSDFLTPVYDITFSNQADDWKKRQRNDHYDDFSQLAPNSAEDIIAFCTPAYHGLLQRLTQSHDGTKVFFRRTGDDSQISGWRYKEFSTPARTNWHYEYIKSFLENTKMATS